MTYWTLVLLPDHQAFQQDVTLAEQATGFEVKPFYHFLEFSLFLDQAQSLGYGYRYETTSERSRGGMSQQDCTHGLGYAAP